jgi:hypothetical protein
MALMRALAIGLTFAALCPASLLADSLPKPRAGLWEARLISPATQQVYKQCTDGKIDLGALLPGPLCDLKWKRIADDRVETLVRCKHGSSSMEEKGLIIGDFNSKVRIETTNTPAGAAQAMTTVIEARWIGPCGSGQKPGSAILSSGAAIDAPFMSQLPFMMQ